MGGPPDRRLKGERYVMPNTQRSDRPAALVTGGAGFIGSHLVEALVLRGHTVRVIDDFSTGKSENLQSVASQIDLIEGDIRDSETVRSAVDGADWVFHQAALVSVPLSITNPVRNHIMNVDGTLNLLDAARHAGVRRFIYASSAAIYGDSAELPKAETMLAAPISPYGLSKLIGEQYARLYSRLYGLQTVGMRYFNVYGPRQDPGSPYSGVISIFMARLQAGARPTIYGDGQQTRDFVFVSDVVEANLLAATAPASAAGQVFNVSTGRGTSILDLWVTMQRIAGTDIVPAFAEERPGDVRYSRATYARAREILGYKPRVALADGLRQTLAWSREANDHC